LKLSKISVGICSLTNFNVNECAGTVALAKNHENANANIMRSFCSTRLQHACHGKRRSSPSWPPQGWGLPWTETFTVLVSNDFHLLRLLDILISDYAFTITGKQAQKAMSALRV